MGESQPIRDKKKLKEYMDYLKLCREEKFYIMFLIGIQSGLRVSDILELKTSDIENMSSRKIKEKKTGKRRFLYLDDEVVGILKDYCERHHLGADDYLIYSRKHGEDSTRPIKRQRAHSVLSEAGRLCGLNNIGTHTMRKTFGYHYYKHTNDLTKLMYIFNHSSQAITLRYIVMLDDDIRQSLVGFKLY